MHSRTEQSHLFDLLCEEPCFQSIVLHSNARSCLKKCLQRGRKDHHLVKTFGMAVLHAAPVVCVSRMDGVKLEHLRGLPTNSMDDVKVKRITMNLVGLGTGK
jgi:hypothetical protein